MFKCWKCVIRFVSFPYTCKKSLKIPKGGNQNPKIEEEQTTQWPKEKGQTTIYKTHT